MNAQTELKTKSKINKALLLKAYRLMHTAKAMAETYEENKEICSKYVHATSRGHEAIQLAAGLQLLPLDFASLYYRDDSVLLAMGFSPLQLMLQLMAKRDDPFSGGRTYYAHPSVKREGFPTIPHQSSATGMQVIPATGMAHGIAYLESQNLETQIYSDSYRKDYTDEKTDSRFPPNKEGRRVLPISDLQSPIHNSKSEISNPQSPIVLCSLGDGAITEGEISEAFQMAVLKKLPILYLVQDNQWDISASAKEVRAMDAYEFAAGFKGMERIRLDGSDFIQSYIGLAEAIYYVRTERSPVLVHAKCPLLGHHTSGVRKEWYRDDLAEHQKNDPIPKLKRHLLEEGESESSLNKIEKEAKKYVIEEYEKALKAPDPDPKTVTEHEFVPTPVTKEKGNREPKGAEKVVMVDAALHAVDELLKEFPEALFYGQDVGGELGGVFREAATLAKKYGDARVFNTPIQEAYIVGSTAGMSAVGCKAIVEIQFADYIWPGINQLVEELSKSCYLSMGKFPVQSLIRIPIGAYGSGGPYHSGSVESTLLTIRGIKVVYPSNAADMKGLMKASFLDPNPVVMLEHKGLYWSKVPGTEDAKTLEPDPDYILPLGKANIVQTATATATATATIITYGMGVHWAKNASKKFPGSIEILDLRTLNPLDWQAVVESVNRHNKVLVLTEEPLMNSFAESLAGRISKECFEILDAPVYTLGAENLPAVALNSGLEQAMLPNAEKVGVVLKELLEY